jgi:hypothetical protein
MMVRVHAGIVDAAVGIEVDLDTRPVELRNARSNCSAVR